MERFDREERYGKGRGLHQRYILRWHIAVLQREMKVSTRDRDRVVARKFTRVSYAIERSYVQLQLENVGQGNDALWVHAWHA